MHTNKAIRIKILPETYVFESQLFRKRRGDATTAGRDATEAIWSFRS